MKALRTVGLFIAIAAFSAAVVNAQSTAKLVGRNGDVEVFRGGLWIPLMAEDPINVSEKLRTSRGSSAVVELGPGRIVTLGERSEMQVAQANGLAAVSLESGNMKVVSVENIQISAKGTILEVVEKPLDLEFGYQADKLNVTVITGAVKTGPIIIRSPEIRGVEDSNKRTYVSDSRRAGYGSTAENTIGVPNNFYVCPSFFGNSGNPAGIPSNVQNPYNGFVPGQIIPPVNGPVRPSVRFPSNPFPTPSK